MNKWIRGNDMRTINDDIWEYYDEMEKERKVEVDKVWGNIPYDKRLEITEWLFLKLDEHLREGGTYRTLIYKRLGFNEDAYSVLYPMGMNISNAFNDLNKKKTKNKL